jgi:hypothetical protein
MKTSRGVVMMVVISSASTNQIVKSHQETVHSVSLIPVYAVWFFCVMWWDFKEFSVDVFRSIIFLECYFSFDTVFDLNIFNKSSLSKC